MGLACDGWGLQRMIWGAATRRQTWEKGTPPHFNPLEPRSYTNYTGGMPESSPQSSQESISTDGVFVGRQRELGELRAALEESLAGRGRLAMLVGEPGIGKTRTAQELAFYAQDRGA